MDWPVTARTTQPHVRRTVADRELETWLAVDLSASLDFGTAQWLKRDLVVAAATAMAHLTVRGGNRIGAVVGTGSGPPFREPAPVGLATPPDARRCRAPPAPVVGCRPGPGARRRRGCCGRSPVPRSGPDAPTWAP